MTRLILIRHGETDWNVENRWQGQADVPLNANGRAQAHQVAERLKNDGLQAIYASDLERTRETARELTRVTGLEVRLDPRLREIHQGDWQGMLASEIETRYAWFFQNRPDNLLESAPPGGETIGQVQARVIAAIQDIVQAHPGGSVAVVSHGFAIAVILAYYQGVPPEKIWDLLPRHDEINEIDLAA
jgi:broad specificity phosphatase PhoE